MVSVREADVVAELPPLPEPPPATETKTALDILRQWLEGFSEDKRDNSSEYRQGYIDGFSRAAAMIQDLHKQT